jgi:hypothetical protein
VSLTFIRWGGLAAIVGGVGFAALLVFGGLWYPRGGFPPTLTSILVYLWLIGSFGIVALGIATRGLLVLPWWCWALIILGSPPAVFLYIVPFSPLGGLPILFLMGIAWALVGYVLFRRAGDRLRTPRRVR